MIRRSTPRFHYFTRAMAALTLVSGSVSVGVQPASAGDVAESIVWDDRGQVCVTAFDGAVVITTPLAPNFDEIDSDPWANPIKPSGTITRSSSLTIDFDLPDGFFDSERFEAGGGPIYGTYMMGLEFVDDCASRQPTSFTPCFTTTEGPDPWQLDLGDLHMLFFFYADEFGVVSGTQSSTLVISEGSNGCDREDPDGGLPDPEPEELLDLIDELNLEFEYDLQPDYDFDIDIDHYRRLAEAQEEALPDTL